MFYAILCKELLKMLINILTTILCSKKFDYCAKLRLYFVNEVNNKLRHLDLADKNRTFE